MKSLKNHDLLFQKGLPFQDVPLLLFGGQVTSNLSLFPHPLVSQWTSQWTSMEYLPTMWLRSMVNASKHSSPMGHLGYTPIRFNSKDNPSKATTFNGWACLPIIYTFSRFTRYPCNSKRWAPTSYKMELSYIHSYIYI